MGLLAAETGVQEQPAAHNACLLYTSYTRFAIAMDAKNRGDEETLKNLVYPDLEHGIDGIRWVTKCVESADKGGVWVDFK